MVMNEFLPPKSLTMVELIIDNNKVNNRGQEGGVWVNPH